MLHLWLVPNCLKYSGRAVLAYRALILASLASFSLIWRFRKSAACRAICALNSSTCRTMLLQLDSRGAECSPAD